MNSSIEVQDLIPWARADGCISHLQVVAQPADLRTSDGFTGHCAARFQAAAELAAAGRITMIVAVADRVLGVVAVADRVV